MATRAGFRVLLLGLVGSVLVIPAILAAEQRPIVAVFGVELGPRVKLPKAACDGIADYLATRLIGGVAWSDRSAVLARRYPQ